MKKKFLLLCLSVMAFFSQAQRITKLTFANQCSSVTISVLLNENVTIKVSPEGSIAAWGVDLYADRAQNYFEHPLKPYEGRVEQYGQYDNEAFRGKLKYIGNNQVTYYGSYEDKSMAGKIKTIGNVKFSYYTVYDDALMAGKMKSAGDLTFSYYNQFDNDAFKGKVKSTGMANFTYYSSFDDKAFAGKIKSLNGQPFTYYSSIEQVNFRGGLKSGNMLQVIGGITYWLQ